MSAQFEDFIGKALIAMVFSAFTVFQIATIVSVIRDPSGVDYWGMTLLSKVFSLIFMLMVVYLTVTRLPPKGTAAGSEPRVSALVGTFLLMMLIVLPVENLGSAQRIISTGLIVIGTLSSAYCLYWLGRSFSIMATARGLVTHGPYSIVRHPLYFAEALTAVGLVLSNGSLLALLLGVVQFAFQFRRMQNEEKILRQTFSEYDDYAKRVPMIIPGLRMK